MRRLIIGVIFAAGTLLAPGTVLTVSAAGANNVCDGDVPEAWRRPGGYCEQIDGGSLVEPGENVDCVPLFTTAIPAPYGARVRVAGTFGPCDPCPVVFDLDKLPVGDRLIVAVC